LVNRSVELEKRTLVVSIEPLCHFEKITMMFRCYMICRIFEHFEKRGPKSTFPIQILTENGKLKVFFRKSNCRTTLRAHLNSNSYCVKEQN
jgi:hypothetical protein